MKTIEINGEEKTIEINGEEGVYYYTGGGSFYYIRDKVIKVIVEDGVTEIGRWAFYGCTSLISITIPNSVTSIKKYAFSRCKKLKEIRYEGTMDEFNRIKLSEEGVTRTFDKYLRIIKCIDGEIKKI